MNIKEFKLVNYPSSANVPTFLYSCVLEDGDVKMDFTGENAIVFPDCLRELGYNECRRQVSEWMVRFLTDKINKEKNGGRVWPDYLFNGANVASSFDTLGLNPDSKNCVATLAVGAKSKEQLALSEPFFKAYADRIGADYRPIKLNYSHFPLAEKFRLREYLEEYERVIFFDADVILMPTAEDLFAAVPEDAIGIHDDYEWVRNNRTHEDYQKVMGSQGWPCDETPKHKLNSGVMVLSKCHKGVFSPPLAVIPEFFYAEQCWMNLNLLRQGHKWMSLPRKWNWQYWIDKVSPDADTSGVQVWHASGAGEHKLAWLEAKAKEAQAAWSEANQSAAVLA